MSHNIHHAVYPENVNRSNVQFEWDDYAAHEDWQEGCCGLDSNIRWIENTICTDEEEAYDYIEKHDRGDYDQLAVRFYEYPAPKNTKKYADMKAKAAETRKAAQDMRTRFHFADHKAAFIGCKHCGSKISKDFLKSNRCPVCGHDLRPVSTLDAIARAEKKAKDAEKALKAYEKELNARAKKQAKPMWLVKIEYHS